MRLTIKKPTKPIDVKKIKQEYDKVKGALIVAAPFINSLLSRVKVILTWSVETAAVTRNDIMLINPEFWLSLDWAGKAWVLGHETLHIAFRDAKRVGNRSSDKWNVAADAINNELQKQLMKMPYKLYIFMITIDKLYNQFLQIFKALNLEMEDLQKMSKEELYKILPEIKGGSGEIKCPKCGSKNVRVKKLDLNEKKAVFKCSDCGHEWEEEVEISPSAGSGKGIPIPIDAVVGDLGEDIKEIEGTVLQEGDPEIYNSNDETEIEEKWKENIARAYQVQKTIGTVPLALRRIVEELLKGKIDWRNLLRQAFRIGFGKTIVSTYKRPSRKHQDFPGIRRFTLPTVFFLVDASGSMSKKELEQALTEIYNVAGMCEVKVLSWDAQAYDIIVAKNKQEVVNKAFKAIRGGGGTIIAPALQKTLKHMKFRDIVVVFSDFEIFDLDKKETKELLLSVASKSSVAIGLSTHRDVELPGWRFIKIEVN